MKNVLFAVIAALAMSCMENVSQNNVDKYVEYQVFSGNYDDYESVDIIGVDTVKLVGSYDNVAIGMLPQSGIGLSTVFGALNDEDTVFFEDMSNSTPGRVVVLPLSRFSPLTGGKTSRVVYISSDTNNYRITTVRKGNNGLSILAEKLIE